MLINTLLIVGPGGVGKSPLDKALKPSVVRIDPYRLRADGPRDRQDVFYAHSRLRHELEAVFAANSIRAVDLSPTVRWFSAAKTLFLKVRDDWQVLVLEALPDAPAKAEIFAPAVPTMLTNPEVKRAFGDLVVVVLNPVKELGTLSDFTSLQDATRRNCERRGDDEKSVAKRVKSVAEEATAWREMIKAGATEFANWQFPEFVYTEADATETLLKARRTLVARIPRLEEFFVSEAELRQLA